MEASPMLERPLQGLAGFLIREALRSTWWRFPTGWSRLRYGGPEEALAAAVKRWGKSISKRVESGHGVRVRRRIAYSTKSGAALALFLEWRKSYYVYYVEAGDIAEFRAGGKKYVLPTSLTAALALLHRKYWRAIDPILPRYKRRMKGEGYLAYAIRTTARPDDSMVTLAESVSVEKAKPLGRVEVGGHSFRVLERDGVEASQSFIVGVNCYRARMVFEDYKARYIIIIPPLILWKWGHVIAPVSIYDSEKSDELCQKIAP